jgi:hypothetical protein
MTKIIFAATIFFSLNSCKKKCLKCELGGVTKTYPLTCGKADDRDLLMLECLNEAMKQNNNGNLTNCSCIEQ